MAVIVFLNKGEADVDDNVTNCGCWCLTSENFADVPFMIIGFGLTDMIGVVDVEGCWICIICGCFTALVVVVHRGGEFCPPRSLIDGPGDDNAGLNGS